MIVIFCLNPAGQPEAHKYFDNELSNALKAAEKLRALGFSHVTISSEVGDLVGKMGVDAVEDGKTPDGEKYEWSKAHRSLTRKVDPSKPVFNDGEAV